MPDKGILDDRELIQTVFEKHEFYRINFDVTPPELHHAHTFEVKETEAAPSNPAESGPTGPGGTGDR